MTSPVTAEQEYELVYQGICAVAAHCDGAVTEDFVGFDGQDTRFGRRIASVPFDQWSDQVKVEASRIANKYQKQILRWTDIDVTTLSVVQFAKDISTNHLARDHARAYERRAKGADKIALRKIDVVEGQLGIFYDRKDPDFDALLVACKALPGRRFDWEVKANVVPVSPEVSDFILSWDFPVTPAAEALLAAGPDEVFNITLAPNGQKVVIDTPYDASLVSRIQALPGRSYVGGSINHADVHPAVVTLASDFGLKVHPDARAACEKAQEALDAADAAALDAQDRQTLLAHVSRLQSPEALPGAFLDLLEGVLAR
jgi:hypothetical protein